MMVDWKSFTYQNHDELCLNTSQEAYEIVIKGLSPLYISLPAQGSCEVFLLQLSYVVDVAEQKVLCSRLNPRMPNGRSRAHKLLVLGITKKDWWF